MKINLAKSAGFCFGVKRAIEIALKTASGKKKVYMLGDIVHNEEVTRQIRKTGIKNVKKLSCGKNRIFLIRAHGIPYSLQKKARGLGYEIVDATCPMVKEIHKIAKTMEQKGYTIIVIGDKAHDEVIGIIGQLKNKALVIDGSGHLPLGALKKIKKACALVQSTQNSERVTRIEMALKQYIKELKFFNTICGPTKMKQEEIKKMPRENDVMVIIGSRKSANTKRLYEISKAINKNSYWIHSAREVRPEWFKNSESIGITAGASTPDPTTQDVVGYIKRII